MSEQSIEVVARAIARAAGSKMAIRRAGETLTVATMCGYGWEGDGANIDKFVDGNWQKFENEARAAIEAMREPSPEIRNFVLGHTDCESFEQADEWWSWAIDAALK